MPYCFHACFIVIWATHSGGKCTQQILSTVITIRYMLEHATLSTLPVSASLAA